MVRRRDVRDRSVRVVAVALGIVSIVREVEPGTTRCRGAVGLGTSLMCPLLPCCHFSVFIESHRILCVLEFQDQGDIGSAPLKASLLGFQVTSSPWVLTAPFPGGSVS